MKPSEILDGPVDRYQIKRGRRVLTPLGKGTLIALGVALTYGVLSAINFTDQDLYRVSHTRVR